MILIHEQYDATIVDLPTDNVVPHVVTVKIDKYNCACEERLGADANPRCVAEIPGTVTTPSLKDGATVLLRCRSQTLPPHMEIGKKCVIDVIQNFREGDIDQVY